MKKPTKTATDYEIAVKEIIPPLAHGMKFAASAYRFEDGNRSAVPLFEVWGSTYDEAYSQAESKLGRNFVSPEVRT